MPTQSDAPIKQARVLVVEDEAIIAMDIAMQLREMGHIPVGHATNGNRAIELTGHLRPDLILMDVQLSGSMDGIAAAAVIHSEFATPLVFLSAFDKDNNYSRAKLTEPAGYITKPFSENELRAVIESALANRPGK